VIREIKFRPKIAEHDYATKKGHVERFLRNGDKVKVTIMFRGREVTHPERGEMILTRLSEELEDLAAVAQRPIQDGRNMTMMLDPLKAKEAKPEKPARGGGGASSAADEAPAAVADDAADAAVEEEAPEADADASPEAAVEASKEADAAAATADGS
jgi:translation initiation factor IF-3